MALDNFRSQTIVWDKANRKVYEDVRASSGDENGRKLTVQVVNDGVVESLVGYSLNLAWETKDKTTSGLDAFEAVDISKGKFTLTYKPSMLQKVGALDAQLVLIGPETSKITSENFKITVFGGVGIEGAESSNEFSALTTALATVNQYDARIESKADKSKTEQSLFSLNQQLAETDVFVDEINVKVEAIGSGSPKGVYETLSELKISKPIGDENIYVIKADSNWYYWNGTDWTSGGVYQSTVGVIEDTALNTTQTWSGQKIKKEIETTPVNPKRIEGVTTTLKPSRNLLDLSKTEKDGFYAWDTGIWERLNGNYSSGLIPVKPNTTYLKPDVSQVSYWDKDNNYVSGATSVPKMFKTPNDPRIASMRLSIWGARLDGYMLVEGYIYPKTFVPFNSNETHILSDDFEIDLKDGSVNPSKIKHVLYSENVFDKNEVTFEGYLDWETGTFKKDFENVSSDFIKVFPNKMYTRSSTDYNGTAFYDKNKTYISGVAGAKGNQFITPPNCHFVVMTLKRDRLDSEMLMLGDTLPSTYYKYGEKFGKYTLPKEHFEVEGTSISDVNSPNGNVPLFIETYFEGGNQPTHPSVIEIPGKLNGYQYYMTCTPYPYWIDGVENPHILVSNDLIKWITPDGLTNPIAFPTDTVGGGYLSDSHLVYVNGTLECWYRHVTDVGKEKIYRKKTTDGINWTAPELLQESTGVINYVSPAIVYDEGKYKVWVARGSSFTTTTVRYFETVDGKNWIDKGDVLDERGNKITAWHLSMSKTDTGYELLCNRNLGGGNWNITHLISDNPASDFTDEKVLLENRQTAGFIDAERLYRACLLKVKGYYYVFYGIADRNNKWRISLSIATKPNDITSIRGIDEQFVEYMAKPTRKPKYGVEGEIVFDRELNKLIYCTRTGTKQITSTWMDMQGNPV